MAYNIISLQMQKTKIKFGIGGQGSVEPEVLLLAPKNSIWRH